VVTNFFRDQLDRYSEIDMVIDKIATSIKDKPNVKLVLNIDDPFCFRLANDNYIGYGLDSSIDIFEKGTISDSKYCAICQNELVYTKEFYGQLGYYTCSCGFNRPIPKYLLTDAMTSEVKINDKVYLHHIAGSYNIYNILGAIALLKELNINDETINNGLLNFKNIPGRMQLFKFDNHNVYVNLVKNHAGMNLSLQEFKLLKPKHVTFILNDYTADGKDVSWIWDADFEYLLDLDIDRFFIAGTRCFDMALRLKNMGIEKNRITINPQFESLVDSIITKDGIIIASYSALWNALDILKGKEHK
jgi:UDP-N-acetylmuramyl tripeptide synthase